MKVRTRFAPSPSGMIHVGNARTALINKLFSMKEGGDFILRIDDTDRARSTKEFEEAIIEDLKWLGLEWSEIYNQSSRFLEYEQAKQKLIDAGRLYECYESQEELELKRKFLLSNNKPPIYDRSALKLSEKQKEEYRKSGRRPHYRFKLDNTLVEWKDMIKGSMYFEASNISDPIIIKEDGSMTYMLATCVDDMDMNITHVIRGEDHVSNTAIQIQIMRALHTKPPIFGHLSLIKTEQDKISKRVGGFDIRSLRENIKLEAMAINSMLANIGTKNPVLPYKKLNDLLDVFNISNFGTSPTNYSEKDLEKLNHKILLMTSYEEILPRLHLIDAASITKEFWEIARPNLHTLADVKVWWSVCNDYKPCSIYQDSLAVLKIAKEAFENTELSLENWPYIIRQIKEKTGLSGHLIFKPLRAAITGLDHGPELSDLSCAIGKEEIIRRLDYIISS
ncbi:MAG: glutamate--tRNA ligase [Alphaproteobacteria bacterium]|nr:glutamate--tRNA ligase [Alphaproteobacteria bacterium]